MTSKLAPVGLTLRDALNAPWRMDGSVAVDRNGNSLVKRFCLGSGREDWPALVEAVNLTVEQLQNAFDSGFKAAGGTMIPDNARDHVEFSVPRCVIDYLANALEASEELKTPAEETAVEAFLENISIFRRKPHG